MSGAKKTYLVYEVNLDFNIAAKYLEILKDKELVRHEDCFFSPLIKERFFMKWLRNLDFKLPFIYFILFL